MNNVKAIKICEDLGSAMYSDSDKACAIHRVLHGGLPSAYLNAALLSGIARWLFDRMYIFDGAGGADG